MCPAWHIWFDTLGEWVVTTGVSRHRGHLWGTRRGVLGAAWAAVLIATLIMVYGHYRASVKRPLVRGAGRSMYCGPNSLVFVLRWLAKDVRFAEAATELRITAEGCSLADLQRVSRNHGLEASAVRCSLADLANLPLPAIISTEPRHFEVLCALQGDRALTVSPPSPPVWELKDELAYRFAGFALVIETNAHTKPSGSN